MEGAEDSIEKFNRSVNFGVSRDLPEKFTNRSSFSDEIERKRAAEDDNGDEIELSLGLSLNGRFGLDPTAKRLKRSSSVSNLICSVDFFHNGSSSYSQARGSYAPLARTCSLPAATDEWRRRKELNSLKSMEARKKRMEKLKNGRVVRDKESFSGDVQTGNGLQDDVNGSQPMQASQRSSGVSYFHEQMVDGTKKISKNMSSDEAAAQRPSNSAGKGDNKHLKNPLLDMPYVTTRGGGPNGTKIEGFLYRFRKGEDVKIVCVCHGLFLSPAEFVKHGGGGDVVQPLKHIVVNPFPLF